MEISQPILKKLIDNINKNNISSQAYFLSGSSVESLEKYSTLLAKNLICPKIYHDNCHDCNICKRIDDNNYPELKIISPENGVIKKDTIISLRDTFQSNSIEGKSQVYIINDAETLNTYAANSLLKFLEEPDSNTIAIFNSTNIGEVINTIISRCQIINIRNDFTEYVKQFCNFESENINDVIEIFCNIEESKMQPICNMNELMLNKYNSRKLLTRMINILIFIYYDFLNYNIFGNFKYFHNYPILEKYVGKIDNKKIMKKIFFLLQNVTKLNYNVNMLLFVDNLLIGIGAINDDKSDRN